LCPHEGVAENVATAFGLIAPDYETIRAEHASALKRMAEAFEGPQRKGDRDALPAHRRGPRKLRGRGGTLLLHQGRRGPHRNRPGSRRGRRRTGLPDRPRKQGAADPRIRSRHGDAVLRPPRRRPRRDRRLQGPHRRRLEGLRSPGRAPGREEGRNRPDGRLRRLTPPAGTERSPPLFFVRGVLPLPEKGAPQCPSASSSTKPTAKVSTSCPATKTGNSPSRTPTPPTSSTRSASKRPSPTARGRSPASGRSSSSPGASASATPRQPS